MSAAVVADTHTLVWHFLKSNKLSATALADPATAFEIAPLDLAIALAVRRIPRDLISDMPDRIIAATALHLGLPPITLDRKNQAAWIITIW